MSDNSPEKSEATAPIASTEEASAPEIKATGETELATKDDNKTEEETSSEDAKETGGEFFSISQEARALQHCVYYNHHTDVAWVNCDLVPFEFFFQLSIARTVLTTVLI